jgi:alkylation response protein AidB-like acyl-CoA dehydrogenase
MNFGFTEDQEALRETVRRFLTTRCPPAWVRTMLDDRRGTTAEVWDGLVGLGLPGLLVPEQHGGHGGGWVDMGVALEEMGRAVHPGPFFSSAVAAVAAITQAASEREQGELLPGIARGRTVATLALLEPDTRHDWSAAGTMARRDGESWTLHGTKLFVPDGEAADVLLVTARAGEELGLFAVDAAAPRLARTGLITVDGTRRQAEVTLAGTAARRLGRGDATVALGRAIDRIVLALVVDGVGAAARALELATEYAKVRVQFDRPIGSFQAVQHLLADMLRNVELARSGAYYAMWAADAADDAECHRAAVMAKAYASDALVRVTADAIQVLGGIGFTWEHDAHLYYKRTLSLQQAFGGGADFEEEYARLLLDRGEV